MIDGGYMTEKMIQIQIQRQNAEDEKSYWENFEVPHKPNANIISCLMDIQKNPVTKEGKKVAPIVWESNCLEEVCGTCTMIVNGKVRQSCSALIDKLEQPIRIQPMSKFPVVRDLIVDRNRMFENLKKIKGWVPVDGYYDLGPGPRLTESHQQTAYKLSECMTCGSCLEACPQFGKDNDFIGAQVISQIRYFNMNPAGKSLKNERMDILMQTGGLGGCGNAQNCVEACPKGIPLTESIAAMGRDVSKSFWKSLFR